VDVPHDFSRAITSTTGRGCLHRGQHRSVYFKLSTCERPGHDDRAQYADVAASRLDGQVELNVSRSIPTSSTSSTCLPARPHGNFHHRHDRRRYHYIDDKTRGLHEGYLLTPFARVSWSRAASLGNAQAFMAGMSLTIIGGLIAGIPGYGIRCAFCISRGYSGRVACHDQPDVSGDGAH